MKKRPNFLNNEAIEPYLSLENKFKAESNGKEAKLYIYGDIGKSWWDDTAVCANDIKNFLENETADTIHVHINSLGGDVFEGIAIMNQLKSHKSKIIIHVDGIAASIASVIAMSGDEIVMPESSMLMVHNALTFAIGNAKQLRKIADDLDKVSSSITEAYMGRFVGEREELAKLLDEETFLTASEAVALGLADKTYSEEPKVPSEPVKNSLLLKYSANVKVNVEENKKNTRILDKFRSR